MSTAVAPNVTWNRQARRVVLVMRGATVALRPRVSSGASASTTRNQRTIHGSRMTAAISCDCAQNGAAARVVFVVCRAAVARCASVSSRAGASATRDQRTIHGSRMTAAISCDCAQNGAAARVVFVVCRAAVARCASVSSRAGASATRDQRTIHGSRMTAAISCDCAQDGAAARIILVVCRTAVARCPSVSSRAGASATRDQRTIHGSRMAAAISCNCAQNGAAARVVFVVCRTAVARCASVSSRAGASATRDQRTIHGSRMTAAICCDCAQNGAAAWIILIVCRTAVARCASVSSRAGASATRDQRTIHGSRMAAAISCNCAQNGAAARVVFVVCRTAVARCASVSSRAGASATRDQRTIHGSRMTAAICCDCAQNGAAAWIILIVCRTAVARCASVSSRAGASATRDQRTIHGSRMAAAICCDCAQNGAAAWIILIVCRTAVARCASVSSRAGASATRDQRTIHGSRMAAAISCNCAQNGAAARVVFVVCRTAVARCASVSSRAGASATRDERTIHGSRMTAAISCDCAQNGAAARIILVVCRTAVARCASVSSRAGASATRDQRTIHGSRMTAAISCDCAQNGAAVRIILVVRRAAVAVLSNVPCWACNLSDEPREVLGEVDCEVGRHGDANRVIHGGYCHVPVYACRRENETSHCRDDNIRHARDIQTPNKCVAKFRDVENTAHSFKRGRSVEPRL